jgi:tetratricopeptide (TPR) repeat protein
MVKHLPAKITSSFSKKFLIGIIILTIFCWGNRALAAEKQEAETVTALFEAGEKHYYYGDYENARHEFKKLLMLDPDNEKAKIYLELVEERLAAAEEVAREERESINAELEKLESEKQAAPRREMAAPLPQVKLETAREKSEAAALEKAEKILQKMQKIEVTQAEQAAQAEKKAKDLAEKKPEAALPEATAAKPTKSRFAIVNRVNDAIAPAEISGEYQLAFGVESGDFIWKDANWDYWEKNWRLLSTNYGPNTYDPKIYDSLKFNIDTQKQTGLNFHTNITVDPWSYLGKSERITVWNSTFGDRAEFELKYWSNTGKTLNETIYTLEDGAAISTPEIKVIDDKTVPTQVMDTWGTPFGVFYQIPELKIDREFWPLREIWLDYNSEVFNARLFPMAYSDQAYSSDDPLGLSNHHMYWEESPWLDRWQPGIVNNGVAPVDFTRGMWQDDLSFMVRDSHGVRLTALRGANLNFNWENISLDATFATPKWLWQDYDSVDNIEGAERLKVKALPDLTVGFLHTFKIGLLKSERDALNNVWAVDGTYNLNPQVDFRFEGGYSESAQDYTQGDYKSESRGFVFTAQLNAGEFKKKILKEGEIDEHVISAGPLSNFASHLYYTHMDEGFYPGLADYRITCNDLFWGRHIYFKEPARYYYADSYNAGLSFDDIDAFRIGDSVDTGRNVVGLRFKLGFFDDKLESLFDVRDARQTNGKYIETVARNETTVAVNNRLTLKGLVISHNLPDTHARTDPFLRNLDTNEFYRNDWIVDGEDPSVKSFSGGLQYAIFDWLKVDGIYERTNDYFFGYDNLPRSLLNDGTFYTYTSYGERIHQALTFMRNQYYFPLPPYDYYNIIRTGMDFLPAKNLNFRIEFTKNDYKFAPQVDDNLNHIGFYCNWDVLPKLNFGFKYIYSRIYNLPNLSIGTGGELIYQDHNNFYASVSYKMRETGILSLQYGESASLPLITAIGYSPYGDFVSTLDTQHIVRVTYTEKF